MTVTPPTHLDKLMGLLLHRAHGGLERLCDSFKIMCLVVGTESDSKGNTLPALNLLADVPTVRTSGVRGRDRGPVCLTHSRVQGPLTCV